MLIKKEEDLIGMQRVSDAVAYTLKSMKEYVKPGMTTKELDDFGAKVLSGFGARSAPYLTYGFPGCTCISVDNEFCHGVPSDSRIITEGNLINIDVSAELNGFWADNGASFVVGNDFNKHQPLVDASIAILRKAINHIKGGVKIAEVGHIMDTEARKRGLKVIKNLGGHGIGNSLHEDPDELLNYKNRYDQRRFKKNAVVAIETFISTTSSYAVEQSDLWTMVGDKGGYMAQHEHTIVVTDGIPLILTSKNEIFA
ncbi:type I methionyl aminopeptidase [Sphingobacterium yanglingense]|uniref:Methionine aminopeptidase n=1 Tax=Sphingobacterium yanglingense TaxID=1437280 RepID=A0A4R6WIL1_9SPHI|nr:type I methionyl aminopeptidase [Sphingobacterium yanglingense]TDQ80073.1 methionine aminopeptidase type I [Sphingobacterium yanglingense]